jgi:hypothetical protein
MFRAMPNNRAVSVSVLGLLLLGCSGTAEGDDNAGAMAGASGTTVAAQSGGGQGAGGSGSSSGGRAGSATTSGGAPGGGSAGSASGGLGGEPRGGAGALGGAGLGGASSGMSGMDTGGGGMAAGASGEGGRSMGGRMGMGGRMAMAGAGGRGPGGMGGMSAGGSAGTGTGDCPASGHVSYTLTKSASPTADEQEAYDLITEAMDEAVEYYNCYTNITKATTVTYVPSVDTADGNSNGSIRFGGREYMEYITAMHEIAHTVGIGTASQWASHVVNGIFDGAQATAKLRELTGIADDQVHADSQHFWPYGLNYTSEVKSEADVINHCYIVVAIRADMGLN